MHTVTFAHVTDKTMQQTEHTSSALPLMMTTRWWPQSLSRGRRHANQPVAIQSPNKAERILLASSMNTMTQCKHNERQAWWLELCSKQMAQDEVSRDGWLDSLCYSFMWSLFDERIVMKELWDEDGLLSCLASFVVCGVDLLLLLGRSCFPTTTAHIAHTNGS